MSTKTELDAALTKQQGFASAVTNKLAELAARIGGGSGASSQPFYGIAEVFDRSYDNVTSRITGQAKFYPTKVVQVTGQKVDLKLANHGFANTQNATIMIENKFVTGRVTVIDDTYYSINTYHPVIAGVVADATVFVARVPRIRYDSDTFEAPTKGLINAFTLGFVEGGIPFHATGYSWIFPMNVRSTTQINVEMPFPYYGDNDINFRSPLVFGRQNNSGYAAFGITAFKYIVNGLTVGFQFGVLPPVAASAIIEVRF